MKTYFNKFLILFLVNTLDACGNSPTQTANSESTDTTSDSEDTTNTGNTSESPTTSDSEGTSEEFSDYDCSHPLLVDGDQSYEEAIALCSQVQGVILNNDLHIWGLQTATDLQGLECIAEYEGMWRLEVKSGNTKTHR